MTDKHQIKILEHNNEHLSKLAAKLDAEKRMFMKLCREELVREESWRYNRIVRQYNKYLRETRGANNETS